MGLVAVIMLATVFGAAGVTKWRAPLAFRAVLLQLIPTSPARVVARLVPILEIGIACWLVSGVALRAAAAFAAGLLIVFGIVLVEMWRRGVSMDCGCFGESPEATTPASGIVRNVGLLLFAAVIVGWPGQAAIWDTSISEALAAMTVVTAVCCLWLGTAAVAARYRVLFFTEGQR